MKKLLLILTACLLIVPIIAGGCDIIVVDPTTTTADPGLHTNAPDGSYPTISEYFEGREFYFYAETASTVIPESGNCPDKTNIPPYLTDGDFFFDASSEVHEDRIVVHISPYSSMDAFGSEVTEQTFTYAEEYMIQEKTDDFLIAAGTGHGRVEHTGGSEGDYVYNFTTEDTWIFTAVKLEDTVTFSVDTLAPQDITGPVVQYNINAPGWDNPPEKLVYSSIGFTIIPGMDYNFRLLPEARLVRIENHGLNDSVFKTNVEEWSDGRVHYSFAASFNGIYVVQPVVKVMGRNGKVLREIIADYEFLIHVTDSPQGDLPN